MKRTLIGPTIEECRKAVEQGLEATLDELFTPHDVNMLPVAKMLTRDVLSDLPPYDSAEYAAFLVEKTHQYDDVIQWLYEAFVRSPTSLQERMMLFWHSLIPVNLNSAHYAEHTLDYLMLMRQHAMGNVRDLMKGLSMTLAMQLQLDDTISSWTPEFEAINENHAREMLELHFMGRADRDGNPNYTQDDVIALAHSLSGWKTTYYWDEGSDPPHRGRLMNKRVATWMEDRWDPRPKTLFGVTAPFDTAMAIDHILTTCQYKVARHVCKRIYYEFVNHNVDEDVVDEMTQHMVDNNMELMPTMRMLLSSEHFFEPRHRMSLVQSPIRFVLGILRSTSVTWVPDFDPSYHRRAPDLVVRMRGFGHSLLQPPTVEGWISGANWLTAPSMIRRMDFAQRFARQQIVEMDYDSGRFCYKFDVNRFVHSLIPSFNPLTLAMNLCTFFLDTTASSAVNPVRDVLQDNPNDPSKQREAMVLVLQSFRAQLY